VEILEESMGFQINIYNIIGLFQLLHVVNIDMCKNERYGYLLDKSLYRSEYDSSTISEGGN
jgi:hypothetical protein